MAHLVTLVCLLVVALRGISGSPYKRILCRAGMNSAEKFTELVLCVNANTPLEAQLYWSECKSEVDQAHVDDVSLLLNGCRDENSEVFEKFSQCMINKGILKIIMTENMPGLLKCFTYNSARALAARRRLAEIKSL